MSEDMQGNSSFSDINWTSSERPTIAIIGAAIGAISGYIMGAEGLYWRATGHLVPMREIPAWIWHLIRTYGAVLPIPEGWIPVTLAGICGVAIAIGGWVAATRQNVRHIQGLRIYTNPKMAAKSFQPYLGGAGIHIHPRVQIGMASECQHTLILGGPGSGKTTTIWPMLNDIIARGDRALVLDFKGDFTAGLPSPVTLLSPADSRSSRWGLGQDIQTRLDAMALAETLIPLGAGEPIWAQGARGLLVCLLAHLQTTKQEKWGFQELAELAAQVLVNYKLLVSIVIREHPPAKAFLMGADSKTTASFLGQLSGALTHVIELGVGDYALPKKRGRWSVRRWLSDDKMPKVAIVGWQPSSKELSQAFAASLIEQLVRQAGDFSDCEPHERRIWLVLDEVAQLGKVPSISDALVTLRSKGVRVVLGLQSVAQNEQSYDRHTLSIWSGATDTKILCRLKSKQDQQFASELVGKRTVERYANQVSQSSSGGMGPTRSGSWQRHEEPVMPEAAFGHQLGPNKEGVTAIMLVGGADSVAMLQWPYHQPETHREPRVRAPWIARGFERPVWGQSPPPIADVPPDDRDRLAPIAGPKPPTVIPNAEAVQKPKGKTKTNIAAGVKAPTMTPAPTQPAPRKPPLEDESDPFGEIVGGALIDAVIPGASVALDVLNVANEATNKTESAPSAPIIPTIESEAVD